MDQLNDSSFDGMVSLWKRTWGELQSAVGKSAREEPLGLLKSIRAWVEIKFGEDAVDELANQVKTTIAPEVSDITTRKRKKKV